MARSKPGITRWQQLGVMGDRDTPSSPQSQPHVGAVCGGTPQGSAGSWGLPTRAGRRVQPQPRAQDGFSSSLELCPPLKGRPKHPLH